MKIYGPYTRKDGRKHIILRKDGKLQTISYPRYLLEKKLGRKLLPEETVDHIDENISNNDLSNLQVLSRAENSRKSLSINSKGLNKLIQFSRSEKGRTTSRSRMIGGRNYNSKFSDEIVPVLRLWYCKQYLSKVEISEIFDLSIRTVTNMLTGYTYSHLGEIGRRDGLRIHFPNRSASSSLADGTNLPVHIL